MKRIVALAAGLVTTVMVSAIAIIIQMKTDFAPESFFFFFIVPMGSIIIGIIAASAYSITLKKLNQKKTKIDYLIALGLGILAGFLIYYTFYKITYLTASGDVIYSFSPIANGYPIAGAKLEDGTVINFAHYMLEDISHRQISFSYNGHNVGTTSPNPIIGWIDFIIELCGYAIGGMSALHFFVSTKFCENCNIYYTKDKEKAEITLDQEESLNKICDALEHRQNIKNLLVNLPQTKGKQTIKLAIENCQQCGDGLLHITFHVLNRNGEQKEILSLAKKIELKNNIAQTPFLFREYLEKVQKKDERFSLNPKPLQ